MGTVTTKVERKCDTCGEWNKGIPRKCLHCGDFLDHRKRDEEKEEVDATLNKLRNRAEYETKPFYAKVLIRFFQALEFLFVTVIGGIAAFLFWLGG